MSEVRGNEKLGIAGRIAHAWINSKLTPLFLGASLLIGLFSIWRLPREEEPQIIVPMIDVMVVDARRIVARSGRARHQADGEAAVGDPGRRVHLLDVQPGPVAGNRALQSGRGRREEHRQAESEDVRQLRSDSAGRLAAAHQAALHRRRSHSGADVFEQPLRRAPAPPPGRAGGRHGEAGEQCVGGEPHRRAAPRNAR